MSVQEILDEVRANGLRTVLLTGGEPLLQFEVGALLQALLDDGRRIMLETSGTKMNQQALALADVPLGVHRVVDLKAPASGIAGEVIDWEGLKTLGEFDEIKVVCADRRDYEWARDLVREGGRWSADLRVAFSPVQDSLPGRTLAEWILEDGLDVCFQIQLHKVLWPDVERGV